MACVNSSSPFMILTADLSSYGLIGLVSLGLLLYLTYLIVFIRNYHSANSSSTVYIHFSQLSLVLLLLSPLAFLFRSSASMQMLCPIQTLSLQILPFCVLLGFNVHFAYEWLLKISNTVRNSFLIACTSFLIFFLAILIQSAVLLIWFYNQTNSDDHLDICADRCHRPLFLGSLIFEFFLLFLYSLQSSLRYHLSTNVHNLTYLLTSLLALCVTLGWICLYLYLPLRGYLPFLVDNDSILAYGMILFAYAFLGPLLVEQFFYRRQASVTRDRNRFRHINKMTFKCLSLTKEQQRAFMAAYIKRNLTASCENLTTTMNSSSHHDDLTRHSTLSVESLCPTLISTISHDLSPTGNDRSSCATMTSVCLP